LVVRTLPSLYVDGRLALGKRFFLDETQVGARIARLCGTGVSPWLDYDFGGCRAPPIFVVGSHHSGTTLVRRVIGRHPQIFDVPEETNLFELSPCRAEIRMAQLALRCGRAGRGIVPSGDRSANGVLSFVQSMVRALPVLGRAFGGPTLKAAPDRWVEKTPGHVRRLPRLFAQSPTAKVVAVVRDGRDAALSVKRRMSRVLCPGPGRPAGNETFVAEARAAGRSCELHVFVERGVRGWIEDNDALLRACVAERRRGGTEDRGAGTVEVFGLGAARGVVQRGRIMAVRYEALVEAPKTVAAELEAFLLADAPARSGADASVEAMVGSDGGVGGGATGARGESQAPPGLRPYGEDEAEHAAWRAWQADRPIQANRAGAWRTEMTAEELRLFDACPGAREMMRRLGYS
jgi:hypothetical protein